MEHINNKIEDLNIKSGEIEDMILQKYGEPQINVKNKKRSDMKNNQWEHDFEKISVQALMSSDKISWRAKGIAMAILLHKEVFEDHETKNKVGFLIDLGMDGIASINSALKELVSENILIKKSVRARLGWKNHITGSVWEIMIHNN